MAKYTFQINEFMDEFRLIDSWQETINSPNVFTALDDINVDRFADYMKSSNFATQFICVTHRRGTMEAADMLYGVTMQEKGVTKLLELNVAELERKLSLGTETA